MISFSVLPQLMPLRVPVGYFIPLFKFDISRSSSISLFFLSKYLCPRSFLFILPVVLADLKDSLKSIFLSSLSHALAIALSFRAKEASLDSKWHLQTSSAFLLASFSTTTLHHLSFSLDSMPLPSDVFLSSLKKLSKYFLSLLAPYTSFSNLAILSKKEFLSASSLAF